MKFLIRKNLVLIFLIAAILASFGLGFSFGKNRVACEVCPPQDVDFSLFWETWQKLEERYVDKSKFNVQEMVYGAISGMVNSLNDPYTVFLKPDDSKRFMEDVNGSFEGVGMEVGIRKGQLQVIAPLEGTPAQKAGFRAGDVILEVNGTSTADMSVDEAVDLIRGPKGTEVTLTVYREEWEDSKEIKVMRDIITIPSAELKFMGNVAYVKLYQFSQLAYYDFTAIAVDILNSQADRIVLDLRNNPGGYLEISQDIAGWFFEKGSVVTIEDFGEGKEKKEYLTKGNAKLISYPIVVLVNQGSASASEILAGALRDNRGVQLIGETSFGKGSVQEMEELSEGSLKVTVAKWLTPKGYSITEKGLAPDIEVKMTDQDYEDNKDPQLDKAIEIINNM